MLWRVTTTSVCTAIALSTGAAAAYAMPTQPAVSFHLTGSVNGAVLEESIFHADGTATARWRAANGQTVAVSGSPGATVVLSGAQGRDGYVSVDLQSPSQTKSEVRQALATHRTSGRSVYQDALNLGWDASEAKKMASRLDDPPGDIWDAHCVDVSGDNGPFDEEPTNYATGHVCNIESIIQYDDDGTWWIVDQITGTGHDSAGMLYSFIGADYYRDPNVAVKYAPDGTIHPSSCTNDTQSLNLGEINWSTSAEVCPDRIDPLVNEYGPGFGSFWHGYTQDYVGLDPTDLIESPIEASNINFNLHVYIHWTYGPPF